MFYITLKIKYPTCCTLLPQTIKESGNYWNLLIAVFGLDNGRGRNDNSGLTCTVRKLKDQENGNLCKFPSTIYKVTEYVGYVLTSSTDIGWVDFLI